MPKPTVVRVSLEIDGVKRGIVTLFQGKDESFYFHPVRRADDKWTTPTTSCPRGNVTLHFDKPIVQDFNLNKLSFHPSGYVHLTDQGGKRFRDGHRIAPFSELQKPCVIAVFVPCDPRNLPELSNRKGFNLNIRVPSEIVPFYLSFALIDENVVPVAEQGPLIQHPLYLLFEGRKYGLAVTMWPVLADTDQLPVDWPPFPFFLIKNPSMTS